MKELKFILTDSEGSPVTLKRSPDGWDESMIVTERSRKYHGIFRSFTIPLKFIKDGASIIRNEFYRHGLAADCSIEVQKLNKYTLIYEIAFVGKINFGSFKDHDTAIEVLAEDGSLSQYIKNKEGDDISFEFYQYDPIENLREIKIYKDFSPSTEHSCYAMQVMYVFTRLIDEITGGKVKDGTFAVKSDFLTSPQIWDKYFLTTESSLKWYDASRIFTFKTNLSDFFHSIDSIFCLGMGIELIAGKDTVVIEEREYFYNKRVILNVGNSKELTAGLVADFNYSKIKVGYPEKSYGDTANTGNGPNNNLEPNTETIFQIPNQTSKTEYDILSKYRGDSNGCDMLWGTESSDTGDTDLFILKLAYQKVGLNWFLYHTYGVLQKQNFSGVDAGLPWNLEISPKRNLLRHKRFINGCCMGLSGQDITLLSATNDQINNETALTLTNRVWEKEYEGFTIDDSDTWFKAVEINIEAAYPANFNSLIAANPYGVIEDIYKKNTYQGYILKMETKLSGAGSVKYSLLSTNDNDLTKLIR